nr:MAG TPA: hypothetical protein [Caudoviricetes sp.]
MYCCRYCGDDEILWDIFGQSKSGNGIKSRGIIRSNKSRRQ